MASSSSSSAAQGGAAGGAGGGTPLPPRRPSSMLSGLFRRASGSGSPAFSPSASANAAAAATSPSPASSTRSRTRTSSQVAAAAAAAAATSSSSSVQAAPVMTQEETDAQLRVDQAQARVDAAQTRADAAQVRVDAAQAHAEAAQVRIDAAKQDLRYAQQDLRAALLRHDNATTDTDKALFMGIVRDTQASIPSLQAAVVAAEATLTTAQAAFTEAQAALHAANLAVTVAKNAWANAKEALNQIRKGLQVKPLVSAVEFLKRGFPAYLRSLTPDKSRTKMVESRDMPMDVATWDDFNPQELVEALNGAEVADLSDLANVEQFEMDAESMLKLFIGNQEGAVAKVLDTAFPDAGFNEVRFGTNMDRSTKGGITDDYMRRGQEKQPAIIGEWKAPSVPFDGPDKHPAEVYNPEAALKKSAKPEDNDIPRDNTTATIVQTFSYLLNKGVTKQDGFKYGLKFGYFTNYDLWCFVKRHVDASGNEVLYLTRWYTREEALLPYAYLVWMVVTKYPNGDDLLLRAGNHKTVVLPRGPGNEAGDDLPQNASGAGAPAAGDQEGGAAGAGGGGAVDADYDPMANVDPSRQLTFKPRSTYAAFRGVIVNFSLLPNLVTVADTEKSCVLRATVGGRDLVARQVDMHNLPHHSEYTDEDLEMMMNREHAAYERLRSLWGVHVPHLVNIGPDFGTLWTTITTYEGESLDKLAESGRLDAQTAQRARESLRALHEQGILHGDVALRNAVRRERDGAVLWVDFEFAEIVDDSERLVRDALGESAVLDKELANVVMMPNAGAPEPARTPSREETVPATEPRPSGGSARVCPLGVTVAAADCTKRARSMVEQTRGYMSGGSSPSPR